MACCYKPSLQLIGYFECIQTFCAGVSYDLCPPQFNVKTNFCGLTSNCYQASITNGCNEICGTLNIEITNCGCENTYKLKFTPNNQNCNNEFCIYPGSILTITC